MSFDHRNLLVVGSGLLLGLLGCEKHNGSEQTQTTGATTTIAPQPLPQNTGAVPMTSNTTPPAMVHPGPSADTVGRDLNAGTIDRLAEARCKRATACNDVGNGKKWNDETACEKAVHQGIYDEYRQNACHTVLTDKVLSCVQAIHAESCDSAFDIARIDACRKDVLCKD